MQHAQAQIGTPAQWWQWFNLLSLDAPLVAGSWQIILGVSLKRTVHWQTVLTLVVAVWSIYVVDRILDGPLEGTARHLFIGTNRSTFLLAVGLINVPTLIWVVPALPLELLKQGLGIAVFCAAYLGAAQALSRGKAFPQRITKSLTMAILFAAGIVIPFWHQEVKWPFLATISVVGANITLVDHWENSKKSSALMRLCLGGGGLVLAFTASSYLHALALGSFFMLGIDLWGAGRDATVLCALADMSLVGAAWLVFALRR